MRFLEVLEDKGHSLLIKGLSMTFQILSLLLSLLLGQPSFHFSSFRTICLVINETESREEEVAIGFFECSLKKVFINFLSCITAAESS